MTPPPSRSGGKTRQICSPWHKIYTKTGDAGQTGLFGAGRVSKAHPRIGAYGEVDELNSVLGLARAVSKDKELTRMLSQIQELLFVAGADLASPTSHPMTPRITARDTLLFERWIDKLDQELAPLRHFILPGGTSLAAWLHLGRTVCRRAERALVAFAEKEKVDSELTRFMNRLSDLLFTMARAANIRAQKPEIAWKPRKNER